MSGSESESECNTTHSSHKIKKKHYDQKYSKLWEKENDYMDWIKVSSKGNCYFHCKACNCDLKCGGGKYVISKHAQSSKHSINMAGFLDSKTELYSKLLKSSNEEHKSSNDTDDDMFHRSSNKRKQYLTDPRVSNWIIEVNNDVVECKYCQLQVKSKCDDLLQHAKTSKHMAAVSSFNSNNKKNLGLRKQSKTLLNTYLSKPTCRVCLQNKDEEMPSIFDVDADSNDFFIYEKIEQCSGIEVLPHKKMPTFICNSCYGILKVAYKFRTTCRSSNEYLKKFVAVETESKSTQLSPKENPLSITENTFEICKAPESIKNEDGSPSHSLTNFDSNVEHGGEEVWLDIHYKSDEDDISLDENVEFSIDFDIQDKEEECIESRESRKESATTKKSPAKTLKVSSNDANIVQQKKIHNGRKRVQKEKVAHVCDICGNIYKCRYNLEIHVKRHREEKPFDCEICGYAFYSSFELKRHMRRHTGSKPYKCKYCLRAFGDQSTLIKHERIHRNERPFKCDTCGKSFTYSNVLKYHKYIHTGEKPHSCGICGKSFIRRHHLRAHLLTLQHQNDPRKEFLLKNIGKNSEDQQT